MSTDEWDIEILDKAYRQGYMHGLAGEDRKEIPYQADVLRAAWEAGWDDGYEHYIVVEETDSESATQ